MVKKQLRKTVESLKHDKAFRKNIPTAEFQPVMQKEELSLVRVAYERRNRDLNPQLVWHGKDEQDWSDCAREPDRLRPEGPKYDSPGQSEAAPWDE